jgi:hypothetical protein
MSNTLSKVDLGSRERMDNLQQNFLQGTKSENQKQRQSKIQQS